MCMKPSAAGTIRIAPTKSSAYEASGSTRKPTRKHNGANTMQKPATILRKWWASEIPNIEPSLLENSGWIRVKDIYTCAACLLQRILVRWAEACSLRAQHGAFVDVRGALRAARLFVGVRDALGSSTAPHRIAHGGAQPIRAELRGRQPRPGPADLHAPSNFELIASEWDYAHRDALGKCLLGGARASVRDRDRGVLEQWCMRDEREHPRVRSGLFEARRVLRRECRDHLDVLVCERVERDLDE